MIEGFTVRISTLWKTKKVLNRSCNGFCVEKENNLTCLQGAMTDFLSKNHVFELELWHNKCYQDDYHVPGFFGNCVTDRLDSIAALASL